MDNTLTSKTTTTGAALSLSVLAEDWILGLEAEGSSKHTLAAYRQGVTGFLAWHARQGSGEPQLDRAVVSAIGADLRRAGKKPATRRLRYTALRRFSAWLVAEGEADADALDGMRPPKLGKPSVPYLSDDELAALVKACQGKTFLDRRDEALVRVMADCGLRASEALALSVEDVDVGYGTVKVQTGKGNRYRESAFWPKTGQSLERYLRARHGHALAHREDLWLPGGGRRSFQYTGLSEALGSRAKRAGIEGFHLHRLRHSAVSLPVWRRAGLSRAR